MLYSPSQVNLHTHSFYCRHGKGTIDEYVQQAKADGLKLLGFSEHCPLPDREYQKGNRMDYEEMPSYEADVRSFSEDPDLRVLLGAECDWLPGEESFYRDELLGRRGYDYLICSVHHMVEPLSGKEKFLQYFTWMPVSYIIEYVDLYTAALESGMFLFGCHPDLLLAGHRKWDAEAKAASRDIIQCAIDTDTPLEINDNGLRKKPVQAEDGMRQPYPVRGFWEMARDMGVTIVTNSDAHRPADLSAHRLKSFDFAKELGIELSGWETEGDTIRPYGGNA